MQLAPIVPNACWVRVLLERESVRNAREHAEAFASAGYSAADLGKTIARGQLKSSPIGPLLHMKG